MNDKDQKTPKPGEGIRQVKTTNVFRVINFELYAKPNMTIMLLGATAMAGCLTYIAYMKYKYQQMGFYVAVTEDGHEQFIKKKSKWD